MTRHTVVNINVVNEEHNSKDVLLLPNGGAWRNLVAVHNWVGDCWTSNGRNENPANKRVSWPTRSLVACDLFSMEKECWYADKTERFFFHSNCDSDWAQLSELPLRGNMDNSMYPAWPSEDIKLMTTPLPISQSVLCWTAASGSTNCKCSVCTTLNKTLFKADYKCFCQSSSCWHFHHKTTHPLIDSGKLADQSRLTPPGVQICLRFLPKREFLLATLSLVLLWRLHFSSVFASWLCKDTISWDLMLYK